MFSPIVLLGACGSDGATNKDAGACPAGQVLRYETPGCGHTANPVCGSPTQDACYRAVCSCKGATISRCDFASEPFASFGACEDGGSDGSAGQSPDLASDTFTAAPIDQAAEVQGKDLAIDLGSDGSLAAEHTVLDGGNERPSDLALDGGSDEGLDVGSIDVGSDASYDAGACPVGQVLRYQTAGCGTEAHPVCGSPEQDACLRPVCSCKGVTISRCDYAPEPYASSGPCSEGGPG